MRQVKFDVGPFPDLYSDGHPPEKECEEERRRYRSGLPSKADLENGTVDVSHFEEAFQEWLGRYKEQQTRQKTGLLDTQKEGSFLVGPVRMADDYVEEESIPASDFMYRSIHMADGKNSKECFVIDLTAVPQTKVENDAPVQTLLGCCHGDPRNSSDGCKLSSTCNVIPL